MAYPRAEGIVRVEQKRGFSGLVGASSNAGNDFLVFDSDCALEDGAEDSALSPDLAGFEISVGIEAGHLRAGSGATRRAIVGFAGTQDKVGAVSAVAAVQAGNEGRAEELDVVDLGAIQS